MIMEFLADLLKIVLPAGLVIYGMYLTIMSFMKKEREKMAVELKTANNPAAERIADANKIQNLRRVLRPYTATRSSSAKS